MSAVYLAALSVCSPTSETQIKSTRLNWIRMLCWCFLNIVRNWPGSWSILMVLHILEKIVPHVSIIVNVLLHLMLYQLNCVMVHFWVSFSLAQRVSTKFKRTYCSSGSIIYMHSFSLPLFLQLYKVWFSFTVYAAGELNREGIFWSLCLLFCSLSGCSYSSAVGKVWCRSTLQKNWALNTEQEWKFWISSQRMQSESNKHTGWLRSHGKGHTNKNR